LRPPNRVRYRVLCTDYDGTLARHGRVHAATVAALQRLRAAGGQLVLVTGRMLPELTHLMPRLDVFARVVAENGALLHAPADGSEQALAAPPPPGFVELLRARGVSPLGTGRVIVATREPHQLAVLETIRELGLGLEVIFNKGAVMVLPAGITKASGLDRALAALGCAAREAVGVGDAENDHSLIAWCGCGVAVANATAELRLAADYVTRDENGAGVRELIEAMLADALPEPAPRAEPA